jgi:hypothetical protein
MSAEISGHTNGDLGQKAGTVSKVPSLFPLPLKDKAKTESPPPGNGGMAQPDPLRELVSSLQRWDDHFQDNIRDVERRLTGVNDRVRKHDELFPVVNQSLKSIQDSFGSRFQSVQASLSSHSQSIKESLNSHTDRIGQHAARLDTHANQLLTVEAGMTQIAKDIAALRAEIGAMKRVRMWPAWLAVLALLGLLVSAAIQFGLVDVATALIRMIDFG